MFHLLIYSLKSERKWRLHIHFLAGHYVMDFFTIGRIILVWALVSTVIITPFLLYYLLSHLSYVFLLILPFPSVPSVSGRCEWWENRKGKIQARFSLMFCLHFSLSFVISHLHVAVCFHPFSPSLNCHFVSVFFITLCTSFFLCSPSFLSSCSLVINLHFPFLSPSLTTIPSFLFLCILYPFFFSPSLPFRIFP